MPKFSYPIPDVYATITRPVALAIVRSVAGVSGIPENTFIEYSGEQQGIPTWRTTLNQSTFDPTQTSRGFLFSKVKVTYEEESNSDAIFPTAYHYPDNTVAWADSDLGILLATQREKVRARISFTYRTADKNEAQRWRNDMQQKMKAHFVDEIFQADYRYLLPPELFLFIQNLHTMRESQAGYGDTFDEYFKEKVIADYTILTTVAGTEPILSFRETQLDILGNFEFDSPPLEEKLDNGNASEITFSYRFGYERPVKYIMHYPLVIHNQVIKPEMRIATRLYETADQDGQTSASMQRYWKMFSNMALWQKNLGRGSIIPSYDDWLPTTTVKDTANLAQFLIRVDPDNPRKVLNLQDLGKSSFDPLLIEYMKATHQNLTKRTGSSVNITIYANDRMMDPRNVLVDENLVIQTLTDMDLRTTYRVRVSLFTQLLAMHPDAADFLKWNPPYLNMIIDGLDPTYKTKYAYPETINGVFVTKLAYAEAARRLSVTAAKYFSAVYQSILMPTELSYLFQVKKKES